MKTKEEILSELGNKFNWVEIFGKDSKAQLEVVKFISQSLDEYADWKIRECIDQAIEHIDEKINLSINNMEKDIAYYEKILKEAEEKMLKSFKTISFKLFRYKILIYK